MICFRYLADLKISENGMQISFDGIEDELTIVISGFPEPSKE